ncbi:ABC transporter substrate-binding protein [Photobacterium sanguinicancri]|uniref:ABC transporter substrate-binding protein n=1 Tax=Photobacterium sanguinicancri TaxID=875932 RepID=UPI0026E179FC|nr:ABC transporter substrate-binding protein [Photobacterium sanguinicancri]MDO6498254.1 ABC transporter substrate-binding protein [Photobacterium sanguinicancri]
MSKFILFLFLISTSTMAFASKDKPIVILTTFSESSISQIINNFQKINPNINVNIIFRRNRSALQLLERGTPSKVDIIISSSSVLFHELEEKDKLQLIDNENKTPDWLKPHILEMSGKVTAFAYSGFGIMYNQEYLKSYSLPIPKTWRDLSDAKYFSHITMSTPTRSGTTSLMVENILQNYGWDKGWQILMKIGGNIAFISSRSFGVSEAISQGLIGVGPVIDNYAINSKRSFNYVDFNYMPNSILMPTYIAITKDSDTKKESQKIIDFLLSEQGQKSLETTSITKFSLAQPELAKKTNVVLNKALVYDRDGLISLLFDQAITDQLHQLNITWQSIYQLEGKELSDENKHKLDLIKHLATAVPVSSRQAQSKDYLSMFSCVGTARGLNPAVVEEVRRWQQTLNDNLVRANQLINEINQE